MFEAWNVAKGRKVQGGRILSQGTVSLLASLFRFLRTIYLSTMLWCLTYNLNLSNQRDSTDWELKISTFTESISILVVDWPGLSRSPNNAISRVNFRWMAFSAIPQPETRTNGLLILYSHNKICRAVTFVCPKYSTFCWCQEFCTIILAEKHKVFN